DNCPSPTLSQTAGPASGSLFPAGVTTITYTATDAGGLTATCTFTVTVSPDTQPPSIVNCPVNIGPVPMDAGVCGAVVSWTTPPPPDGQYFPQPAPQPARRAGQRQPVPRRRDHDHLHRHRRGRVDRHVHFHRHGQPGYAAALDR